METSLIIQEYKAVYEVAEKLATSGLIPKSFKSPADAWYAMLTGQELGLTPIASLHNIHLINGRISLSADSMMALVMAHPQYFGSSIEEKPGSCTVTLKRKNPQGFIDERTATFTMDDAKTASLLGKDNWKGFPKRMLKARAQAYACRDLFPEILSSLLSKEEAEDLPPAGATVETPKYEVIEPGQTVEQIKEKPTKAQLAAASKKALDLIDKLGKNTADTTMSADHIKAWAKNGNLEAIEDTIANYERRLAVMQKPEPAQEALPEPVSVSEPEPEPEVDNKAIYANIRKGIAVLAKNRIDSYDQVDRVKNSYTKHLGHDKPEACTDPVKLEAYLTHLRAKYTQWQAATAAGNLDKEKAQMLTSLGGLGEERRQHYTKCISEARTFEDLHLLNEIIMGE